MISTFSSSADFKLWNAACVCVLCVIYFLDLLTLFVSTAFAIVWTGVNYYLHRRDEDFRHRLSILGLIKRDKSKHNSTPRAAYTKTATPASTTPSRSGSASYDYPRLIPGNKFDTPSRILRNNGVDNATHSFASPVLMSKTAFLTRSCQSTFTPDHGRRPHLDWVPAATRRHPIQQEKYSVGSYPTVCLNKSPLPLAKPFASPELISPVKVKILPLSAPVVQSSTFGPAAASSEVDKQDPCSTESVIQALKERRKRAAAAAYQDCLDPTGSSPNPVQSSKRPRRESLCLPLPPFTPVVTSVGGFGPAFLGSPSKNMVVRSPVPSALVSTSPEGAFKRGRLATSSSPPGSLAKRHRNNAIAISYCSSRGILLQRNSQSQKRKAVPPDSSPASKQTKTDDGIPQGDDEEAIEKNEDSTKENDAPLGTQVSAETSESDSAEASRLRNRIKPVEWSPTPKKRLVYPEHMATLKEHENDQALDKERLNRLLGSLQDVSNNPSATETPVATTKAAVPTTLAKTASLPTFGIPSSPTVSSTAPIQGSTTNTVSVISSPVMSVSSSAASDKPSTTLAPPASSASTLFASIMPAGSTTAEALKPQLCAGYFNLPTTTSAPNATTSSQTVVAQSTPPALLATATLSTASNPLLASLAKFTSPSTAVTSTTALALPALSQSAAVSGSLSSTTPFSLPQTSTLPLPASSALAASPAAAAKPAQPAGGFVFSGPSLGGNLKSPSTASVPTFGAVAASPALPALKANDTNAAVTSAALSSLPGSTAFQFGSSVQVAKPTTSLGFLPTVTTSSTEPFKFGSNGAVPAAPAASVAGPLSSGLFKFGASAPGSQPTTTQATQMSSSSSLTGSSSNVFAFGSSASVQKATAIVSPPTFGSTAVQSPTGTSAGIATQPSSFAFGTSASLSSTTAQKSGFSFGTGNITVSSSAGSGTLFKFGAQAPQQAAAATTSASLLSGTPFAFGAPASKQGMPTMPQTFAFGAPTTTVAAAGTTPFAFGAADAAAPTPSPFAFGAATTTTVTTAPAPFSFGAGTTSSAPVFPQSSASSPLFPSTAAIGSQSSVAQPGGFQFGAVATNGLSNGISSNTAAAQPSAAAPQGLFKFGATNTTPAVPAFNFNTSQCGASATPKPAFNFGAAAATNNLFSIGSGAASSHGDRPIARPRSKRITKK